MEDNQEIPDKCEECGKRRPRAVVLERGMDRSFNANMYIKFVCKECDVKLGADE